MILLAIIGLTLLGAFIALVASGRLAPRRTLFAGLTLGLLLPLVLLWMFQANGYRRWNWWPFTYGSLIPHTLAGIASLTSVVVALKRSEGPASLKALLGGVSMALWSVLWLCGSVAVACRMGDCL